MSLTVEGGVEFGKLESLFNRNSPCKYLAQYFSKYQLWNNNIKITWNLLEMQFFSPIPDLMNQKLSGWGLAVCILMISLCDYYTPESLSVVLWEFGPSIARSFDFSREARKVNFYGNLMIFKHYKN